jgi:ATP-binding cassette subfamily B protein
MTALPSLAWPRERIGEALEALAQWAGIRAVPTPLPPPPAGVTSGEQPLTPWLDLAATHIGAEIVPLRANYHELPDMIARGGPLLLQLGPEQPAYLLVQPSGDRQVRVLAPDLRVHRVPIETIRALLCADFERPMAERIDQLLATAEIAPKRRPQAHAHLLKEYFSKAQIGGCWMLRLPPGAPFWQQLRQAGLPLQLGIVVGAHLARYLLLLGAWWLIGRGALTGQLDTGWLLGWGLLVVTMVPCQVLTSWTKGRLVIAAGGLIKRRLMAGLLSSDPELVRSEGAGQLLGRVVEADTVERLTLGGGYLAVLALVELILALGVLATGAGGIWHSVLLVLWIGLTIFVVLRHYLARDRWTQVRLDLTHDLVERMVGHRTRLAQQPPEQWHQGEDELLNSYIESARGMDRFGPYLSLLSSGWRVVGIAGLAAPFVSGQASLGGLAVGLGGMILAGRALSRFTDGIGSILGAFVAWKRVAPVFHAAARQEPLGDMGEAATLTAATLAEPVIETRELAFSYSGRDKSALEKVDLRIFHGDRLILVGPSGGGKSTLASLLTGIRVQRGGLLLQHGLDLETLGAQRWRRAVTAAPQFHENHVLTATFAFNLLMGKGWPPPPYSLQEAAELCTELGLGDLLQRMPSGLMQMVGDTGWQLSHGECSRLYVARALLQGADLVILDESFGALDPDNLLRAFACARKRAKTLLVIAHP